VEKFISTDGYIPMLTELQTALCTVTVSMEAPRSEQTGFHILKTVRFSGALSMYLPDQNALDS
jgi:hypothetical protein